MNFFVHCVIFELDEIEVIDEYIQELQKVSLDDEHLVHIIDDERHFIDDDDEELDTAEVVDELDINE